MSDFSDERLPARFWAKITIDPTTGCWLWMAATNSRGYGCYGHDGRTRSTHRLTYEILRGAIPTGLTIDHLCKVILCCNPAHLDVVTKAENTRRQYRDQTHCAYGHPLSGANVKVRSNGQRRCIECRREHSRAYRRRKAVAA